MEGRGASPPRVGRKRVAEPVRDLYMKRIPTTVIAAWEGHTRAHGAIGFTSWIEHEYADLLLLRGEVEAAEQAKVKATKRHAGKTYENTVKRSAGDENAADEVTQDNLAWSCFMQLKLFEEFITGGCHFAM